MRWLAFFLTVVGMMLVSLSWSKDKTSSFDDGSFMFQIVGMIVGGAMIIVALGIFAVEFYAAA